MTPEQPDYDANVSLSYDYIEKSIKELQDINNNTNTQLGLLIGFNFTFMRFFINELPGHIINSDSLPCNSCLLFKFFSYLFSSLSIGFCFFGLYQMVKYYIIKPELFIENCDRVSNAELKLAIIDTWKEKLRNFKEVALQKKQFFNRSIICLLVSSLMAVMDTIIDSIFY